MSLDSLQLLQEGIRDLSYNQEMTKVLDMVMDTFYQPLQDDILNFYNPDLCLDYNELKHIFDPYFLTDIISDDEEQSRKYFKIIKTLYSLKGTLAGLELVLQFLHIQYKTIIQSRLGEYARDITLFLDTDSPDLRQFRRIDQLTKIFLPINVRMEGVTNWDIFGGANNWNLGPAILDYGCVFGMNTLDRPYGNIEPSISESVYFYLHRERAADMPLPDGDYGLFDNLHTEIITADLDCTLYQYVQLDRNLILGMQDVTNLYAYSTGSGVISTSYLYNVLEEDQARLLEQYPDTSWETLPEYQRKFEDTRQSWCFGALILDWHAILGDDTAPMDGNRGIVHSHWMLDAGFTLGTALLDRGYNSLDVKCGISRRQTATDIEVEINPIMDGLRTSVRNGYTDLSQSQSWILDRNLIIGANYPRVDDGVVLENCRTEYIASDLTMVSTIQGQGYALGFDATGFDVTNPDTEIADTSHQSLPG